MSTSTSIFMGSSKLNSKIYNFSWIIVQIDPIIVKTSNKYMSKTFSPQVKKALAYTHKPS